MRPFQAPQPKTLTKRRSRREFINLASHYQQIGESFKSLVEEVPHMRKHQLATHLAGMPILPMVKVTTEEKVSSMYGQQYETEEPSRVQEEYNPKVLRRSYRAPSIVLENSLHYFQWQSETVSSIRSLRQKFLKSMVLPRSRVQ